MQDLFKSRDVLTVGKKKYVYFRLDALEKAGLISRPGGRNHRPPAPRPC